MARISFRHLQYAVIVSAIIDAIALVWSWELGSWVVYGIGMAWLAFIAIVCVWASLTGGR